MIRSVAAAVAVLLTGSVALAQPGPGQGLGRGMGMRCGQKRAANLGAKFTTTRPADQADSTMAAPPGGRRGWRWQADGRARAGGCPWWPGCRNALGAGRGMGRMGLRWCAPTTQPAGGRQLRGARARMARAGIN
jgi:hypothetical protein